MENRTRLRDISVSVSPDTPEWPGDTKWSCGWTARIPDGSSVNLSSVTSSLHVGTHADAPLHVRDGWPGSHELPLEVFHGPATVIDVREFSGEVEIDRLMPLLASDWPVRLLLRTGASVATGEFPAEWVTLSESCVRILMGEGLRLLGVDSPSVDTRESKSLAVHKTLFAGNAFILENLDLRRTPAGNYDLIAFPLSLMALDAAPVRAVLVDRDSQKA